MAVLNDAGENKMIQHACEAFADSCACAIEEEGPGLAQAHASAPFSAARVLGRSENIEMSARDGRANHNPGHQGSRDPICARWNSIVQGLPHFGKGDVFAKENVLLST